MRRMQQMAGQMGMFNPMAIPFGAYGAYAQAVSRGKGGWAGVCSGAPFAPAPENRDAYPNIVLSPEQRMSGTMPESVVSGVKRKIQVGVVARRRWGAVLIFKEEFPEKTLGGIARWFTTLIQINAKAKEHQCSNGEEFGPHSTNFTYRGFSQSPLTGIVRRPKASSIHSSPASGPNNLNLPQLHPL